MVHLFPFRTEKLSPLALMVLPFWGWESKSMPLLIKPFPKRSGFFCLSLFFLIPINQIWINWHDRLDQLQKGSDTRPMRESREMIYEEGVGDRRCFNQVGSTANDPLIHWCLLPFLLFCIIGFHPKGFRWDIPNRISFYSKHILYQDYNSINCLLGVLKIPSIYFGILRWNLWFRF